MTPELKYVNNEIEACVFGKSLESQISSKDYQNQLVQQKEFLSEYFNLPKERIFLLEQVHGFDCIQITDYDIKLNQNILYHKADGLITGLKNVLLCIRTADCLPLFFHTNPNKKIKYIGVLHLGWRGIYRGLIQHAFYMMEHIIEKIIFEYKVLKKDSSWEEKIGYPITVFPGIYIPEQIYEVDSDVGQLFPIVRKKDENGKYLLDLWKNAYYIIQSIKDKLKINIEDPFHYINSGQIEIFTNFYSHRRGDKLRNLNIIYIK